MAAHAEGRQPREASSAQGDAQLAALVWVRLQLSDEDRAACHAWLSILR